MPITGWGNLRKWLHYFLRTPGPGELTAKANELVFLGEGTRGPYVVGGARGQFHQTSLLFQEFMLE